MANEQAASNALSELADIIDYAINRDLDITPSDVKWDGGMGWTIDGMPAREWVDAMTMD